MQSADSVLHTRELLPGLLEMDGEPGRPAGIEFEGAMSRLDAVLRGGFHPSLPEPERELLASLGVIAKDTTALSFSTDAASEADERAASRVLAELIDRACTLAHVETESCGRVVLSTWISHGGDTTCAVAPTLQHEALARHVGAVGQTLRERQERMLLLLSILQMASKIALAAGTGDPLLAVTAALKFIRGIVAERETHEARQRTA